MRLDATVVLCILILALCASAEAENGSVFLAIRPVPDDFFDDARDGEDPELAGRERPLYVIGIFNPPGFSIRSIGNVTLHDAGNNTITLLIDKSSIYSEFDDGAINSVRIAFVVDEKALEGGMPRIEWGPDVSAENMEVQGITAYLGDRERYRTFTIEERPAGGDSSSYVATLEVIVDDYADVYYLWYLLPMALIFGMLFVRKIFLK